MKPRKSKRLGYTPSFPALRDELIPLSPLPIASGTGAVAHGSFLPGLAHAEVNDKPPFGSTAWWKGFDRYLVSDLWKRRASRRRGGPNCPCSEPGCPCPATEVHHLNYDRWGKGEELDSDLSPLCNLHHKAADEKRRSKTLRDNAAAYGAARFAGFVQVRTEGGPVDEDKLRQLREEYDEREQGGEGDDYE